MADLMKLLANAATAEVRYEQLEGRRHVVVPIVMMTEGVHKGSGGPILYENAEMAKAPNIWDHKPIVVYHPALENGGASACNPVVLNSQKIGIMLNTAYEGKLKTEGWIDIERADAVDKRVMESINNKEMMEVSTGVFVDVKPGEGDWKGEKYIGTACNLNADHLAILPDMKGACSIADGAGLLRNQAANDYPAVSIRYLGDLRRHLVLNGLVLNDMSFNNVSDGIWSAMRARLSKDWDGWVEDVYPDFLIYSKGGKFYKLAYKIEENKVVLGNDPPEEVLRVTEYRTVSGTFVGNQTKEQVPMNKNEIVNALITNGGWKETDREYLMLQPEADLKRYPITNSKTGEVKEVAGVTDDPAKTGTGNGTAGATTGAAALGTGAAAAVQNAQMTDEQYLNAAPPRLRSLLTNGLKAFNAEQKRLVGLIMNNKANQFTEQYLMAPDRTIEELNALAALASSGAEAAAQTAGQGYQPPMLQNFSGMGVGGVVTTNAAAPTETPLPRPGSMFAKT